MVSLCTTRVFSIWRFLTLAIVIIGCGSDASQVLICADECTTIGAGSCEGNQAFHCEMGKEECLVWTADTLCENVCSQGQCRDQCVDTCTTPGSQKCEGDSTVVTCTTLDGGCLGWAEPRECGDEASICSNGSCDTSCADECTSIGSRSCEGEGFKTCDNYDEDSCLEWGNALACEVGATCSNGYCAIDCSDECDAIGETQCALAGVQTCGDFDQDTCLELSEPVACPGTDVCSAGVCSETCSDECANGDLQCSGNGIQSCGMWTNSGCLAWGTPVSCGLSSTCTASSCEENPTAILSCPSSAMLGELATFDGSASSAPSGQIIEWAFDFGDGASDTGLASSQSHAFSLPGVYTVTLAVTSESGGSDSTSCVVSVEADPCEGIVCDSPEQDSCLGPVARNFGTSGLCVAGQCQYHYADTFCPEGCNAGVCQGPSCGAGVCNLPPANTCIDSDRLETNAPLGTCEGVSCQYQTSEVWCSEGCFNGACIAGSWETETPPLGIPQLTYDVDMVVDALGRVHLAYCYLDVVYRSYDAYGWKEIVVDPGSGSSGCEVSIGLDHDGQAMIGYYEPSNDDLRFARINGSGDGFDLQLVTNSGDVGSSPSVSMTPTGAPLIAFRDASNNQLRTATKTGATWSFETVAQWFGGKTPITQMEWSSNGELYLLAGSNKTTSATVDQPETWLHIKSGATWQHVLVSPDGMIGRRSLQLDESEAHLMYTAINSGSAHRIRYARVVDGFKVDDNEISNASGTYYQQAIGIYNVNTVPEVVVQPNIRRKLDDHHYWNYVTEPDEDRGWIYGMDQAPGQRTTFLHRQLKITTPWACVPSCVDSECGGDGCGGSCGSCAQGDLCDPTGMCSSWIYETTELLSKIDAVATSGPIVLGYDELAGVRKTSWQPGSWTVLETGIDPPEQQLSYRKGGLDVDTQGELHLVAVDYRATHFNAYDKVHIYDESNGAWSGGEVGQFFATSRAPVLKVDNTGVSHVVYSDRSYPDYPGSRLVYATWDGSNYESEVIFTPVDVSDRSKGDAQSYQLAVDGSSAHIIWVETIRYTGQVRLNYSTNASGGWVHETLEAPFPVLAISETGIAIDQVGVVHIAYQMGNGRYYANTSAGGGLWTTEDAPSGGIFRLDENDTPTIALGNFAGIRVHTRESPDNWSQIEIATHSSAHLSHFLIDAAERWHFLYSASTQQRHVYR